MSKQNELNSYIRQLQQRLRLGASLRGVAILTAAALTTTVVLVLILNAFAFPQRSLASARAILFFLLALAALFGLTLPLLRLSRRRAIAVAETARPEFQERLLTFHEREEQGDDPFLELLAANTLSVAQDASPASIVPDARLLALTGAGVACLGVLIWMIVAGPGYLGYGASLIWTGPKHDRAPLYDIQVTPGDAAIRRNSDQLVTARIIGLRTNKVRLLAHYQNAESKTGTSDGWEPVAMQPQQDTSGAAGFQFLFAGLPEDVEYYVEAGPIASRHFKIRVVDLPSVKRIRVTYHYPKWTGLQQVSDEHGGDLRAIEGTHAEIEVQMDHPLRDGLLALDDGTQIHLSGGEDNVYRGVVPMEKDGAYHVATIDQGQQVRLSEDYFIATNKANPPDIAIDRPGGDYRASPIEEVTVGVKAADEFGLNHVSLHYSVNGGAEHNIDLLKQPGTKNVNGTTTLSLEDFKLIPGDVVSLYATARDGHSEAHTEMAFIQADPFEREFSQSQQSGGGGGGGGQGQNDQTDISKREKEVIAATWKQRNARNSTAKEATDAGKFLSEVQTKLREQVLALSGRMQSRDLTQANEEFNSFEKDMQAAASAMAPSAEKLKGLQWQEAIPNEQKALQYLLRAEATFRQIEVAFGQQGGGGGGGGSAGRDLASLFDLELDTEKNQYETAQTGSAADQRAKAVDDVLQKLDALARRQEELAQQQHNAPPSFQERWQQEMLRREAEQLQHQMEQLAQNRAQDQQSANWSSSSSSSNSSGGASGQPQPSQSRAGSSQAQSRNQASSGGDAADPRVEQALSRLRQADDAMKRGAGQQQGSEAARRAAEQLRQATNLLSGTQQQETSGKLDQLSREADRLSKEEQAQAGRINNFAARQDTPNGQDTPTQEQRSARAQELNRLASERQHLSDDLAQLEKGLRDTARQLAPNQPQASSKLRDALGGMDQADLSNRVQRTADWLRRGINPNSNGTEAGIDKDLQRLNDQVRQAQQGLGAGNPSQDKSLQGDQTAALDHVERLRNQLESLTTGRRSADGRPLGQQGGKLDGQGQRGGQSQQNQAGQQGRGGQQGQMGQAGQPGQGQMAGQRQGGTSDDVGNGGSGGGEGTVWGNINTGNNHFGRDGQRAVAPDNPGLPAGEERAYHDGLTELNQLRQLAKSDPEALKEIQDLVREMQRLDPSRFPGNPAIVEQLHTEVLSGVDKLELQLRRSSDDQPSGQVRTSKPTAVPAGYQDAVADYFRRLSKSQ